VKQQVYADILREALQEAGGGGLAYRRRSRDG